MKTFRLRNSLKVSFGGGNTMWLTLGQYNIQLAIPLRGWLWQRGMCATHIRGFGVGLTINYPFKRRKVRVLGWPKNL